jgi:hypothetical protein
MSPRPRGQVARTSRRWQVVILVTIIVILSIILISW